MKTITSLLAVALAAAPLSVSAQSALAAERVTYKRNSDRDLVMTITKPPGWTARDRRPAMIFFYNGGWKEPGATKPQFEEQARYFAARGMVVGQADYREKSKEGPTSAKCVEDIFSGVRWLRGHAAELGVDPKRIAAVGGSGSIHLPAAALHVAEIRSQGDGTSIDPLPGAMFLFNPDPDVLDPSMMRKLVEGGAAKPTRAAPPMVVYYGSRDAVAPFLDEFVTQARQAGLPVEKFVGDGGVHGFFKFTPGLETTVEHMDRRLCALGLLEHEPKVKLPHKAAPPGYEERILATQQQWLERHNELAKARGALTKSKPAATAPAAPPATAPAKVAQVRDSSGTAMKERLDAMLRKSPEADTNKDGVLTMEEARAFRDQSKQPKRAARNEPAAAQPATAAPTPATAKAASPGLVPSRDWDTDQDGKISREEFKAPAQLFQNMDTDGDGFLSGKELVKLDSKLNLEKTSETTWVVPPEKNYHGVSHHTYFSAAMQTPVGYNLYLPDDYQASGRRYPVIYHLHGSGGNESVQIDQSVVYHQAIQAKKLAPVIIVFVNGGRRSYYSDSADGKILAETTIIKELIPHIDATYRTIPEKACRVLHGFSMGGFGALKLGLKYPELFCAALSFSGGMASPNSVHMDFLKHILGGNPQLLRENNPADIALRHKAALQNLTLWLFTGTRDVAREDSQWAHEFLAANGIAHRFEVSQDVGHALKRHFEFFGDDIYRMLGKHFATSRMFSEQSKPR